MLLLVFNEDLSQQLLGWGERLIWDQLKPHIHTQDTVEKSKKHS